MFKANNSLSSSNFVKTVAIESLPIKHACQWNPSLITILLYFSCSVLDRIYLPQRFWHCYACFTFF